MVFILRAAFLAVAALVFAAEAGTFSESHKIQEFPGKVLGSVNIGKMENDKQKFQVSKAALVSFTAYIKDKGLPPSAGISFYTPPAPNDRQFVIAAIGAGSGNHGEQNVKVVCEKKGIPFSGGDIFTLTHKHGYITACGPADASNTNRRNCADLVKNSGNMEDIFKRLKKLASA